MAIPLAVLTQTDGDNRQVTFEIRRLHRSDPQSLRPGARKLVRVGECSNQQRVRRILDIDGLALGAIYALLPLATILSPFVGGQLADRYFSSEKVIAFLQLTGGILLILCARATSFDATLEELVSQGHPEDLVRRIVQMVSGAEYKRRQGAPGIKISPKAFGSGRRMPIATGWPNREQ